MNYRYILSITQTWMGQFNTYNTTHCEQNKVTDRTNYILNTLTTGYTHQAFTHPSEGWQRQDPESV